MPPVKQPVKQPLHAMHPINTRTSWHRWLRPIARVVIAAQVALALQPLSALAQQSSAAAAPAAQKQLRRLAQWQQRIEQGKLAQASAALSVGERASERTSRNLAQVHTLVQSLHNRTQRNLQAKQGNVPRQESQSTQRLTLQAQQQDTQDQSRIGTLLGSIQADTQAVLGDFASQRTDLQARGASAEILRRHDQALAELEQRASELAGLARQWAHRPDSNTLAELGSYFQRHPATKTHTPLDPKKLPWSSPKPTQRAPAETRSAWYQQLHAKQKIHLASATNIDGISFNIAPEPGQAPSAADLAATDETQPTAAIQAKATALGNNPVTIHNWVRNTIEWVPTWGAIQSAQDTLDKQRGNAFDIASLEIALLRAAKIPARYQFGTIDVPVNQLQNWVGGTTKPEAALQILNQGGIAARGLAQAGVLQTIHMEHVWVQAYVNWSPSRGNRQGGGAATPNVTTADGILQHVNPNGPLNAWVPLDPSYKQYRYAAGMDLQTQVPLDANALLNAAQQGATVNEQQGWVQNLNQTAIQNQLNSYQNRLQNYINSTTPPSGNGANSTVGEVIGKKIIPAAEPEMLAGTNPYKVVLQASQSTAIPSSLQHRFRYTLSDNWGNELLRFEAKTSQLAGKRLTLGYAAADQATTDLINSYLPKPHADGSQIQPSELPTSLPGYLIKLKPQITLDGQVVAQSSSSLTMGEGLSSEGGFTELYDPTQWDLTREESNVVGQATAIGISAGGISATQLSQLQQRLQTAQTKLQANNMNGLTGEQISGDLLTATIWTWFASAESHNKLSQNQAGIIENPGLSYGLFHAVVNPVYSWGVARKVTFPGVNIDIGHIRNLTWAKDGDEKTWVNYNRLRGQYMSGLEHSIPERFFSDPAQCNPNGTSTTNAALPDCSQGISAVKALNLAANAGQRIYTITQAVYINNPSIVTTSLSAHSQNTKERVQHALDAGYEVTIHEKPINQSGWTGAGFTVIDPSTGAGAYTIEDGSNGGAFYWVVGALSGSAIILGAVLAILAALTASGFLVFLGIIIGVLVAFLGLLNIISALYYGDEFQKGCFFGGLFLGVGMILGGLGLGALQANTLAVFGAMFPSGSIPQCWAGEGV